MMTPQQLEAALMAEGFNPGSPEFEREFTNRKIKLCQEHQGLNACQQCRMYDRCTLLQSVRRQAIAANAEEIDRQQNGAPAVDPINRKPVLHLQQDHTPGAPRQDFIRRPALAREAESIFETLTKLEGHPHVDRRHRPDHPNPGHHPHGPRIIPVPAPDGDDEAITDQGTLYPSDRFGVGGGGVPRDVPPGGRQDVGAGPRAQGYPPSDPRGRQARGQRSAVGSNLSGNPRWIPNDHPLPIPPKDG